MRRTFRGGWAALILLATGLVGPAWAQAQWVRAESPSFIVFSDMEPAATRRFAERLETFDQVLRLRHGVPADEAVRRKLPIYLLRRKADLQRIKPGADRGLHGFYVSHLEDTYAVAVAGDDDSALLHEYVHHFMLNRFPFGYPGWLVEGYPEYFMTFRQTGPAIEIGLANANRAAWLLRNRWIPFDTLLRARPAELRTDEARSMFYAQSWGLTHWFVSDPARAAQLQAYLDAVGRGTPSVQAMTEATGLTPDQLSRAVRTYLMKGFPVRRFTPTALASRAVTLTPLPPAAADVLLPAVRLGNDNGIDAPDDRTDGPVLLAAVRKAAERHRGDRLADLALARAEIKLGDPARAETLLQARLAADAQDVEALHLLAVARLRAAQSAPAAEARKLRVQARTFAGRAHKLDPNHYPNLIAYAQAREGEPTYPTENDVNVLMDALDLAPQVGVLRVNAAAALARRKRPAEAAAILRPLAFNPHGGPAALAARAMLELMDSGPAGSSTPEAATAPAKPTPAAAPAR